MKVFQGPFRYIEFIPKIPSVILKIIQSFSNQDCIPFVEICSENVNVFLECGFLKNFVLNPLEIEINYDIVQEALIFQTIVVFHSDRLTLELTIFFNSKWKNMKKLKNSAKVHIF